MMHDADMGVQGRKADVYTRLTQKVAAFSTVGMQHAGWIGTFLVYSTTDLNIFTKGDPDVLVRDQLQPDLFLENLWSDHWSPSGEQTNQVTKCV